MIYSLVVDMKFYIHIHIHRFYVDPWIYPYPQMLIHVHSEPKKLCHYAFVHNFDNNCLPIFKILSLLYSPRRQEICKTKLMPRCPSHLRCVAALPCET